MTETAQPETAAESEVATVDAIAAAANAFKTFNPDAEETQDRLRDDKGRFAREEIEAEEAEAIEADATEAESHEDEQDTEEAAEEAQPEAVDMPTSWPSEHAETWTTLPPETQALIAEREGQRDAAVNAKFQEAANVKKANEAVIAEANTNRQRFAEAADLVTSLIVPQRPPSSMLHPQSADYNPDAYHLAVAEYERSSEIIAQVKQQREEALAQLRQQAEAEEQQLLSQIEEKTRPALLKDVPDLADPAKQPTVLTELVRYAIAQGIPEHVFTDPEIARGVTSAQLHMTWKAQQYDKMVAAKGQVQPKAAKPSAPVVRPGVTTSRSAIEAKTRKSAFDRLEREGSVEAAAAIFKLQAQGKL